MVLCDGDGIGWRQPLSGSQACGQCGRNPANFKPDRVTSTASAAYKAAKIHPRTTSRERGAQELIRLDAEAFNELASTDNLLRDTLTVLAAAAWCARRRLGIAEPVWTLRVA